MNTKSAIKAYGNVGLESEIMGADPHKLISMLFQGALLAISNAKNAMQKKQIAEKGAFISKAIAIIDDGLNASLDKNVGGEIAQNLSGLYTHMIYRLIDANLKNDTGILDEISELLTELRSAWDGIRPQVIQNAQQAVTTNNAQRAYGSA